MKTKKVDWVLMDIVSQKSLDLSEQDFEDIQSAICFAANEVDPSGAKDFIKNLKKLGTKLFKLKKAKK